MFIDTPTPPYDVGDLWTDSVDIYVCATGKTAGQEFDFEDWSLATNYAEKSATEEAIREATLKITGNSGGYVILHDSTGNNGDPNEILIVNDPNINKATQVWRWNKGGLGFATSYSSSNYALALNPDGTINASRILTGTLDASVVNVKDLTAKMFKGSKLELGGKNNGDGTFVLYDGSGIEIGVMNNEGLKFFGDGPVGSRPYVKLDLNGLAGYDANNNKIFWVNRDEFTMEKCVARQEINACQKIKFIPVTIRDGSDNIINDGVACVPIVEGS